MVVRFWGVRGGIPTPEAGKLGFGGNTSCLSVELPGAPLLILDAGTGIRMLGNELQETHPQGGLEAVILFSHLHWDHIQGIPFFKPLFHPANSFEFIGLKPEGTSLRSQLEGQQNFAYFPVDMSHMSAIKRFREVEEEPFTLGTLTVTPHKLKHPGGCLGWRLDAGGVRVVYATDTEHDGTEPDEGFVRWAQGADLLIFDCTYTPEEYAAGRRGWGHSTWRQGVLHAQAAGAGRLVLFHHDQDRGDAAMAAIEEQACAELPRSVAAREGMRVELKAHPGPDEARMTLFLPGEPG